MIRKFLVFSVVFYQSTLSLLFTALGLKRSKACPFYPTCSEYAKEAVQRHGALKGGCLAIRRVARCLPGTAPQIDQVPK